MFMNYCTFRSVCELLHFSFLSCFSFLSPFLNQNSVFLHHCAHLMILPFESLLCPPETVQTDSNSSVYEILAGDCCPDPNYF